MGLIEDMMGAFNDASDQKTYATREGMRAALQVAERQLRERTALRAVDHIRERARGIDVYDAPTSYIRGALENVANEIESELCGNINTNEALQGSSSG